ncbi:MAG: sugar ABC transporter substrate-binding protein [Nitrospiraceae bacterium]|nr:MAG: sugar ABC transporter substrate-binding protein [Nitrospiraceae bacterium]
MLVIMLLPLGVLAKDYVIGDGDTLSISVWGSPELSLSVTVRPDGKISVPAVGEIKASGLTPKELTAVLEKEVSRVVKTPIVTVIVTAMTNYRIFVAGKGVESGGDTSGNRSGAHLLTRETTLLEFLSQLGSLRNADLANAYLVRDRKKIKTGFYRLFEKGDYSQDIVLEPNDMLFIPDNFEHRINVVGAVTHPTTLSYREGLTVMDVILLAGGFTEFAKENDVEVVRRKENGESTKITVKAKDLMKGDLSKNVAIMPGDVVVVKESLF